MSLRRVRFSEPINTILIESTKVPNDPKLPILIERWIKEGPISVQNCKLALQWVLQCSQGNPHNDIFVAVTVCALNEAGKALEGAGWKNGDQIKSYIDKLKVANNEDYPSALGFCLTMYSLEENNLNNQTLYHIINQILLQNSDNYWQLFGAFCFCLLIAIAFNHNENYQVNHRSITCFRKMRNIDLTPYQKALKKDLVIEWKGFTSTSLDENAASNFGDVMFKIEVMGNTRPHPRSAIFRHRYANFSDISEFSQFSFEQEVLLLPPNYFKVLTIENNEIWLDKVAYEGDILDGPIKNQSKCIIL
jgi:hypothetical protein